MIDIIDYFKSNISKIKEIKHFDLWNNQIYNEKIENPYNTPAVFLNFDEIPWDTSIGKMNTGNVLYNQKGVITISLWIVVNSLSSYIQTFYTLLMPIRTLLLAKFNLKNILGIGTLVRRSEEYDNNHDTVSYWKVTFSLSLMESLEDSELQEALLSLDLSISAPVVNPIRSNKFD